MNAIDHFKGLVNRILTANFGDLGILGIEEVVIKMKVYDIFESNFDLEKICDELTEYLADDDRLSPLIPEIKQHYINSFREPLKKTGASREVKTLSENF